jgi:hypothetical protein
MDDREAWSCYMQGPFEERIALAIRKATNRIPLRKPRHGVSLTDNMTIIPTLAVTPIFAAVGYSLIYLLCGGGLGGAILIFIVAKMLGK